MLNTEKIRDSFAALKRTVNGSPVAYFDGPGGTQVPEPVIAAVADYLRSHNANTHWNYTTSHETDALLEDARETLAAFLNAGPDEIAFGNNMTTLTFHLARALGRQWQAGDEVVITELDHHANVGPWQAIAKERGIVLRRIPMDPATGLLQFDPAIITPRCKLLAIGAASNALGTVSDLTKPIARAKKVGALVFIDAVHYAPHFLVDVQQLQCDFLGCSSYKFYGPHVGIMFARQPLLNALDVPKLEPAGDVGPERLETGTLNHEGIVGAAAAVRYIASLGAGSSLRAQLQSAYGAIHARQQAQLELMWRELSSTPGVRCYGPNPSLPRTSTIGFTVAGIASSEVAARMSERGVYVSHGDFYAKTVVEKLQLGEEGLVRAGDGDDDGTDQGDGGFQAPARTAHSTALL